MNLKQLAGRVRHAVKGSADPAAPEPGGALAARPAVAKDQGPRDAAPRPETRRPDIGRTADVRPGTENTEGAGRAGRWKASTTVPDLATVYKEAGIESPLHGYGVDKLTDMLASPYLAQASREVRATAAQVALDAARVPLRDIIDDALLRSKALAAFEADKAFDLQASQMRGERRAQVLRDQVDAFRRQKNAEIDELRRGIDAADQALSQLRARKRREEERLHRIVTYFVEPRPAVAAPPPVAARPAVPVAPPSVATPIAPPPIEASLAPPAAAEAKPGAARPIPPATPAPAATAGGPAEHPAAAGSTKARS